MHIEEPTLDNPLDSAVRQLHDICQVQDLLKSSIDIGTVRRMLVHITNINLAVLASTRDHVNAAKRLNDFALTLARIARDARPPNEELTARLVSVTEQLRAASQELSRSDSVPAWRAPAAAQKMSAG